jgi:hypothetical protein
MSETGEGWQRCPAIRKGGERCSGYAAVGGYCIGHSPDAAEARRKGGYASSRARRAQKLMLARLRPISDLIEHAIQEVHDGGLPASSASAMGSLATALLKLYQAGELEERLRNLEAKVSHG